MHAVTVEQPQ